MSPDEGHDSLLVLMAVVDRSHDFAAGHRLPGGWPPRGPVFSLFSQRSATLGWQKGGWCSTGGTRQWPIPRRSRSWLLWAIAVAGIAVLTGVLILSLASARLEPSALRIFLVGWIVIPYVVSGLLAWWRRPASRLGPLMLLTGFVMGLVPLQWSSQPLLYSVGHLLDMVPAAMFLHTFLAFPTGRLTCRGNGCWWGRRTPSRSDCRWSRSCWGSIRTASSAILDSVAGGNVVEGVQLSLVAVCLLLGAVRLYRRRSGAGRSRRPAALVVDAFGLALVMLAAPLHQRALRLAVRRDHPAGHLRRSRPGADRVPVRPARPPARPRRRRRTAGGAAGRPDRRPAGPARPGPAGPVAAAVLLAARVRRLGRPGG